MPDSKPFGDIHDLAAIERLIRNKLAVGRTELGHAFYLIGVGDFDAALKHLKKVDDILVELTGG